MKLNIKFIIIVFMLAVAAINSWQNFFSTYMEDDTVSIHGFPLQIGEWQGEEIPIAESDLAILETKNAFAREYKKPDGDTVILFVVYSQKNRRVAHPPEICYSGGGLSILSNESYKLVDVNSGRTIETRRMFVEAGRYQQAVNYWFKVGDSYTADYYRQQFLIAMKTLLQRNASSAMIRISADVENGDVAHADQRIRDFAFAIQPLLSSHLP